MEKLDGTSVVVAEDATRLPAGGRNHHGLECGEVVVVSLGLALSTTVMAFPDQPIV